MEFWTARFYQTLEQGGDPGTEILEVFADDAEFEAELKKWEEEAERKRVESDEFERVE